MSQDIAPLLKTNQDHHHDTESHRRRNYGTVTSSIDRNSSISSNSSDSDKTISNINNIPQKQQENNSIVEQEKRSTLSFIQKFGFGLGHIYNDLCAAVWFSYTLLFLQSALLMDSPKAGALVMLGQISDAFATPIFGYLTDRFSTKRQWHIYGTVFVFLTFPMIFSLCPWCSVSTEWWKLTYFSIYIILFQSAWACVQISHLSMIPEMSITERDRKDLTAMRYSSSVCANVVVYMITWAVLKEKKKKIINNSNIYDNIDDNNIGPSDAYRFRDISLLLTLIGLTMVVLFHFSLAFSSYEYRRAYNYVKMSNSNNSNDVDKKINDNEQQNHHEEPSTSATTVLIVDNQRTNSTIIVKKNFFKTRELYQNAMLYVFARLFTTTSLVYMPLWLDQQSYQPKNLTKLINQQQQQQFNATLSTISNYNDGMFNDNAINIEHLAKVPLVSFLASFVASVILKNLTCRINHRLMYFIGSILSLIGCILIVIISQNIGPFMQGSLTPMKLYLISIFFGSGSSITMITSLCITSDMIGEHSKQGGIIYSSVTFADKFITGIVIVIIENLKCKDPLACRQYYQNILAYGCGLAAILGLLVLSTQLCNKFRRRS